MRNAVWIALIALVLATGWYLWSNLEPYETTIDSGYSREARRDPLLALARLLQNDDIAVRRADSAARLGDLSQAGALIATDAHYLYTQKQVDRVLAWVEQGGHLIVASGDEQSALLTRFGVGFAAEADGDAGEQMVEALEKIARASGEALPAVLKKPPLELHFEGAEGPLSIDICSRCRALTYNSGEDDEQDSEQNSDPVPFYGAGIDERTHFLQFEYGDGIVSVVTELDFWHNDAIGEHDHAYLAHLLAGNGGDVVLLSAARTAPLTTLIWRAAPELVTALALLLSLWLWHRAARFGPLREAEQAPRRALAEHLLASARYQWQQRQIASLLQPLRNELQARYDASHGQADPLSPAQRQRALEQSPGHDPEQLRAIVTDLQTLDRTLP